MENITPIFYSETNTEGSITHFSGKGKIIVIIVWTKVTKPCKKFWSSFAKFDMNDKSFCSITFVRFTYQMYAMNYDSNQIHSPNDIVSCKMT